MEKIVEMFLTNGFTLAAGIGVIGLILNFILKKFVTNERIEKWGNAIRMFFKAVGILCTAGLSKIPYLKNIWNPIIEPYVVILLKMVFKNMVDGFINGLESDNKSLKDD